MKQRRSLSQLLVNDRTQFDVLIPSTFAAASAVCYVKPELSASVLFLILTLSTIFIQPVVNYFTAPATENLTGALTEALNTITDERNRDKREKLFGAVSELISESVNSPALQSTIKQSLLSSLMDEDLHDASLDTIQLSLVKASQNDSFQSATLGLIKQAFTAALNDEAFVGDLMQSIVGAIVQASKEEELTKSVMDVVTLAVSQALNDERFVAELRGAIKDTLQDGDIYKAGAKGMLTAAFGGGKTKDQKEEVSQAGQISARFLLGRPSAS